MRLVVLLCSFSLLGGSVRAQSLPIIGYYAGRSTMVDSFPVEDLSHIIFSFVHLKGDSLWVNNANDTLRIKHLVSLKTRNPSLKVILSMGGWGGCRSCSDVFKSKKARKYFARSVKETLDYFGADGIDLDWEYPALENVPGYPYAPVDKDDFTDVVRRLRKRLGRHKEITFAAGGFTDYILHSIDWKRVTPNVDRINLMTYDLANGYSTVTGHHTPLYSTPGHIESTDHAVHLLDSLGVPAGKIAIGAAFYGRIFENVDSLDNGLFRPAHFRSGMDYKYFSRRLSADSGFVYHWDPVAQAPYLYNPQRRWFVTYDDTTSMRLKTRYALDHHLGGIMFWELGGDAFSEGLLEAIYEERKHK
jgi:chitinase